MIPTKTRGKSFVYDMITLAHSPIVAFENLLHLHFPSILYLVASVLIVIQLPAVRYFA